VHETNSGLASIDQVHVDDGQDTCNDWARRRRASHDRDLAVTDIKDIGADRRNIRIRSTDRVVDTTIGTETTVVVACFVVQCLVSCKGRWVVGEVLLDDSLLVRWLRVDVAEATAGVEASCVWVGLGDGLLGILEDVRLCWEVGCADRENVCS
jgi:hypothetical protein